MEGYVVQSYKLAKRILQVQPTSVVIVVENLSDVRDTRIKKKINTAVLQCSRVRILFPFTLVNEEIVRCLIKSYVLERIRIPNNILRSFPGDGRVDYSSLTDLQLISILKL